MSYNEIKRRGTDDFPFELYLVDENSPKYVMSPHLHSDFELIKINEGELCLTLDGKTFTAKKGDAVAVNPEVSHGAIPHSCKYSCVVFQTQFLKTGNRSSDDFFNGILSHGICINEKIENADEKAFLDKIIAELKERSAGYEMRVSGLAMNFFGEAIKNGDFTYRASHLSEKNVKLKRVFEFVRKNYSEQITLEDMADEARFSTKHFCEFFKRETGYTPIEYLITYRIERAAKALLSTDNSVTRIAFDCGFNDASYFTKTFKRLKGVTPKDYAAQTYSHHEEENKISLKKITPESSRPTDTPSAENGVRAEK